MNPQIYKQHKTEGNTNEPDSNIHAHIHHHLPTPTVIYSYT